MSVKPASLDQIQRWMQSVIMHPHGVAGGVASHEARKHLDVPLAELESVINPSAALDGHQRLEIYVDAYYARLLECLAEEYAVTRSTVAEDLFSALAFGYLQQHPSRSYTLQMLGAGFPAFLAESRLHAHDVPGGAPASWPEFIVELARFERMLRDVFDGPGSEHDVGLDPAILQQISTDRFSRVRLTVNPSLKLACFCHPVLVFWREFKADRVPHLPEPLDCFAAVFRRDYTVERRELTEEQYTLLTSIAEGQTVGLAIAMVACRPSCEPAVLEANLSGWFANWVRDGLFATVDLAE